MGDGVQYCSLLDGISYECSRLTSLKSFSFLTPVSFLNVSNWEKMSPSSTSPLVELAATWPALLLSWSPVVGALTEGTASEFAGVRSLFRWRKEGMSELLNMLKLFKWTGFVTRLARSPIL